MSNHGPLLRWLVSLESHPDSGPVPRPSPGRVSSPHPPPLPLVIFARGGLWDEQCLLKISYWSESSERLSSDFLLPLAHRENTPLLIVPIVVDELILLVEFVDR